MPTGRALTVLFLVLASGGLAATGGTALAAPGPKGPPGDADLSGEWRLNPGLSQPSPLPPPRRRPPEDATRQPLHRIPPEDSVLPEPTLEIDPSTGRLVARPRRPPSWLFPAGRLEALRLLLGETDSLTIVQTRTYVDLRSGAGSRSLQVGAESQVSLPTGELADQRVRWRGNRLVVERRVPRGARLVEAYRLLAATGQLEVTLRRSAGDGLPGLAWRRVFDRDPADADAATADPAAQPAATDPNVMTVM